MNGGDVDRAYQLGEAKTLLALVNEALSLRIREDELLGREVDEVDRKLVEHAETWLEAHALPELRGLARAVATSPSGEVATDGPCADFGDPS